jgi:UDP-N-acetylmuramyl pentapeptide synthase
MEVAADELASVTGGRWEVRPATTWRYRGLGWTWHTYAPGRIVVARGKSFRYGIDLSALKRGMGQDGVMLGADTPRPKWNLPILRVDSIHQAIGKLAGYVRAQVDTPIIAVTGSVGKTTTCHLLHHLLGGLGAVAMNGQNNYPDGIIGEAANLGQADYGVFEASLQGLGEATTILKPHVAVVTQVSPVHLAETTSLLELATRKASLFNALAPGGTAVINMDIPYFTQVLGMANANARNVVTFGEDARADFHLVDYDIAEQRVKARVLGEDFEYELGIRGRHMAINSLGVLAGVHALGVDWRPLLERFAAARPVSGRGTVERLQLGRIRVCMIDDAYNASPAAMEAAFTTLGTTRPTGKGRRIAVLGDMLELGDDSPAFHRQLAGPLLASGIDKVHAAGEMMKWLWEELPPERRASRAAKAHDIIRPLVRSLTDGDVILLKGSHGTGVHQLAEDLRFLAMAPDLGEVGLWASCWLVAAVHGVERYAPIRIRRWVAWEMSKAVKH